MNSKEMMQVIFTQDNADTPQSSTETTPELRVTKNGPIHYRTLRYEYKGIICYISPPFDKFYRGQLLPLKEFSVECSKFIGIRWSYDNLTDAIKKVKNLIGYTKEVK